MQTFPSLLGDSIFIRHFTMNDASDLLSLRKQNHLFLQPFEPLLEDSHFTLEAQQEFIHTSHWKQEKDISYSFGIFTNNTHQLIGRVNLSNVVRGVWQNCTLGYFLDEAENKKGYTTQAIHS